MGKSSGAREIKNHTKTVFNYHNVAHHLRSPACRFTIRRSLKK